MVRYPLYMLYLSLIKTSNSLFYGLGLYSGIFAMYFQGQSNVSRTGTIVFYAVCLLYFLSTVTFVSDVVALILEVSNNSMCKNITFLSVVQSPSQLINFRLAIVQAIASGCCDFLAQFILVHKPLCLSICFIHINLKRFTVVGSCGVKISVW